MPETNFMIADKFQQIAVTNPDRDALVFADMTYSYKMLWHLTCAFAVKMKEHDVSQSSTIQMTTKDLPVVVAAMLASSLLGARFAEASISDALAGPTPITHRFGTAECDANSSSKSIVIDESWSPAHVSASNDITELRVADFDLDMPWLIFSTSGTTGTPKVVPLSQRIMLDRSVAVADEYQAGITRVVSLFPYNCRPFFARVLGTLMNGATIVDRGSWGFWMTAGVNRIVGSVSQAKALDLDQNNHEKIELIEISGAKLQEADARRLLRSFSVLDDTYGATETSKSFSTLVTITPNDTILRRGASRDSIVSIADEQGNPCAAGEIGEIRVRNNYCAEFYQLSDGEKSKVLRDGYFYPGDLGSWGENGGLEVHTRKQAGVLNVDGVKLSPRLIEATLQSVAGISQAAVFESPKDDSDDLIAFVVVEKGENALQLAQLARKTCKDTHGAALTPAKVWPINGIPRQVDGQPDYAQCARILMERITEVANER